MAMVRPNIQLPASMKAKLDGLRAQGTTTSGYIRSVLARELKTLAPIGKRR